MIPLQTAIKLAAPFTGDDRTGLDVVRVEPARVWATDGHRAVFLATEAPPESIGTWREGALVTGVHPVKIDQTIPKDPPLLCELDGETIQHLEELMMCVHRDTAATLEIADRRPFVALRRTKGSGRKETVHQVTVQLRGPALRPKHETGVNVRYLLDAIDVVWSDRPVSLYQADTLGPILIRGARGFCITMPCRV